MAWVQATRFLAQVQSDQALSTDLKWLRFPQATSETVTMFIFVMMAIVLTFIATMILQGWLQSLWDRLPHRQKKKSAQLAERLDPGMRLTLDRLKPVAGTRHVEDLLTDPVKFEKAVAAYVAAAPAVENLNGIGQLRRRMGFTVMNPMTQVFSTRQLLPDLTVRIVATIEDEKLDLYCPLLEVTERHLLIDVPYQKEFFDLLSQHPDVYLLFWREADGETAFRVKLLQLHSDHFTAFRCVHALRADDMAGRTDFRLTVDLPVTYQFVNLQSVMEHRETGKEVTAVRGEGKMVDLSHGGASFLSDSALGEHGFAQLHFTLSDQPLRVMMEVLNQSPASNGMTLVRGKFRGLSPELGGFLNGYLSREQFRRIQMHPTLVVGAGKSPEAKSATPAAETPESASPEKPPVQPPTRPATAGAGKRTAPPTTKPAAPASGKQAGPAAGKPRSQAPTPPESAPRARTSPKPPPGSQS